MTRACRDAPMSRAGQMLNLGPRPGGVWACGRERVIGGVVFPVAIAVDEAKHAARDLVADRVDLLIARSAEGHEAHAAVVAHVEDTVGHDRVA